MPSKKQSADKIKKVSRKDLSKMNREEVWRHSRKIYRRLLTYIKPYKGRWIWGIVFSVLFGLSNGFMLLYLRWGIGVMLPGKGQTEQGIVLPMQDKFEFIAKLRDKLIVLNEKLAGSLNFDGSDNQLIVILLFSLSIPVLVLFRGVLNYLGNYCMIWVGSRVLFDLRHKVFANILLQSQSFFNEAKTGNLIQTVFNQTRMTSNAAMSLASDVIKHPVSIISMTTALFISDWIFAVFALFVFPLCILPVIHISKKMRKAGGDEESRAGELLVSMQETFSGIRVVKSHAREEFEVKRFNNANRAMMNLSVRWKKAMEIAGPIVETVASLGIAIGFVYAWYRQMNGGEFMILYLMLVAIYPHAKALSRIQILMQKCLAAASQVFELIDQVPDICDKKDALDLQRVKGKIEFRNVTFSYGKHKDDTPAVRNFNFTFHDGKSYALVGATGAGKSTIFSLLLRFYEPQYGKILLDNHDIRDIKQQNLRDNIGLVNQDVFLFHDSIFNNILYGKLDASKDEVINSARHAHAEEFILKHQNKGYESIIGDSGVKLSGGQKQRLTIARAILRNAPILLLDEATSAVDSETELKIKDALDLLSKGKTTIAIAHRLSTVLNADKILYMEKGEIKQIGSHEELLKSSPGYRRIYQLQFSSE